MQSDLYALGFQGSVATPTSENYEEAIKRQSATAALRPAYVCYPIGPADISLAIKFALTQDPPLEIAVKSGGCHTSTNASTDGGLVVDLALLKGVEVSEDRKTVAFQSGCLWGDVYSELEKHGLKAVGGSTWFVGVGGYMTGGGYSNLSGQFGLAIDNLVSAEIVLADGRIVRCSADDEPDLFWAIRGGGNQFGIVTEFVARTYPIRGPALSGALFYAVTDLKHVLGVLHEFLETQPATTYLCFGFARSPPHFQPSIIAIPYVDGGDSAAAEAFTALFQTKLAPLVSHLASLPSLNTASHAGDALLLDVPPRGVTTAALFSVLYDDVVEWVFNEWLNFTDNEETKRTLALFEFFKRGKVDGVAVGDTAYSVRAPHWYMALGTRHTNPELDKHAEDWADKVTSCVKRQNAERTGQMLPTPANMALGPDYTSTEEVYGENLPRLRKIKAKYDPTKVWRRGWVIEPSL
ncbi:hypothetical protein EIP91_004749 [Steccherinum ochraceum]|uniref:FAD-binding PCMH-type domain-containing protein n=1 Tax=Steccherinum ochraceum TaxID=92696 RepID=A0A4R0RGL1_9APHY|nr:hypothetical protein EIP91_004749 [Steccherinum ochraceum]